MHVSTCIDELLVGRARAEAGRGRPNLITSRRRRVELKLSAFIRHARAHVFAVADERDRRAGNRGAERIDDGPAEERAILGEGGDRCREKRKGDDQKHRSYGHRFRNASG